MNKEDICRITTENHLTNELENILANYMVIYDEYYATASRDSAFLKDVADAILGISAVLEVYARDKYIYPKYALEKLNFALSRIESGINYYEDKQRELDGEESDEQI